MDKATLLETLRVERARWESLLARVDEARMAEPGAIGAWSIKDMIAHITWYEEQALGILETRTLAGSDLWDVGLEQRNAAIFDQNRDRPLPEVLSEAQQVYERLLAALEMLSDEDLVDSRRFANMPDDWKPWEVISSNSFEHYLQHTPDLRDWLDSQRPARSE